MPSRKNFQNKYKRDGKSKDIFKQPKIMVNSEQMSEERRKHVIDWITFYRRNMHRFVEHYFGISLYPYQILWLYLMSINDSFVAICSRAVGKDKYILKVNKNV